MQRPVGITLIAVVLGLLGGSTLLAQIVGAHASELSLSVRVAGFLYGVAATIASVSLWQLHWSATWSFGLWSLCLLAMWPILAAELDLGLELLPSFLFTAALLGFGWRYVHRRVHAAAESAPRRSATADSA